MLKGLFVGINDYPGVDADLSGCVNDAHDWAAFFKPLLQHEPVMLLDDGATKDRIVDKLKEAITSLKPGDVFVFTFSGHGTWLPDMSGDEPDGRDEALCPYDLSETNLILDDELREILVDRDQKSRIVMITDSCHSGSVFRMMGPPGVKRKIRFLPPANFVKDPFIMQAVTLQSTLNRHDPASSNRPLPGIAHYAGCRDKEYSFDAAFEGRPNGAFTRAALTALKSLVHQESRPVPTYGDLARAVTEHLPSFDYPQTPRLNATAALKKRILFT